MKRLSEVVTGADLNIWLDPLERFLYRQSSGFIVSTTVPGSMGKYELTLIECVVTRVDLSTNQLPSWLDVFTAYGGVRSEGARMIFDNPDYLLSVSVLKEEGVTAMKALVDREELDRADDSFVSLIDLVSVTW